MRWLDARTFAPVTLAIFGFFYAVFMPPFMNPDEDSHFFRVQAIVSGRLFPDIENGVASEEIPASLIALRDRLRPICGNLAEKYPYANWYADSHAQIPSDERELRVQYSASRLSPLQYLPHVLGYLVGHIVFLPFHEFYNWSARILMARLGSLLFAVVVARWTLSRLPVLRYSFAATILLPMPLVLAAAVSSDTMLLYACIVFAATIVRINVAGARTALDGYALLAAAFVIGSVKFVYLPLLAAVVLLWGRLPAREFRITAAQVAAIAVAAVALTMTLFLPLGPPNATAVEQIQYLRDHPGQAVILPFRSLIAGKTYYFISMIMNFGALDTNLAFPILLLIAWVYAAIVLGECCREGIYRPRFRECAFTATATISCLFPIFLIHYVSWTSQTKGVGVPVVDGVQGRYFLPLLLNTILCLPLIRVGTSATVPRAVCWLLFCFVPAHLICLLAVLARYWVA